MSLRRYIAPEADENGQRPRWSMSADQIVPVIKQRWPDAGIYAPGDQVEFSLNRDGQPFAFNYHPGEQYLSWRDREPQIFAAEVVRWFLDVMGRDIPVVYFDEVTEEVSPIPPDATTEEIARDILGAVL